MNNWFIVNNNCNLSEVQSGERWCNAQHLSLNMLHIPKSGGVAVYKARSMLYFYNDSIYFDDQALCAVQGFSFRLADTTRAVQLDEKIKLYPNPTNGQFTIEFDFSTLRRINIYNSLGQRVYSTRSNEQIINLDLSAINVNSGLLLIEAINEETQKVYKTKIIYDK